MRVIPEEIREFISYNPETGAITRIKRDNSRFTSPPKKKSRAKPAVPRLIRHCDTGGYIQLWFRGSLYQGARVAWFLYTGYQPDQVDHINGNPKDNRICNLRSVTQSENLRNAKCHRSGQPLGVTWDNSKNKWRARVPVPGTSCGKYVGLFETAEEAGKAVADALSKK